MLSPLPPTQGVSRVHSEMAAASGVTASGGLAATLSLATACAPQGTWGPPVASVSLGSRWQRHWQGSLPVAHDAGPAPHVPSSGLGSGCFCSRPLRGLPLSEPHPVLRPPPEFPGDLCPGQRLRSEEKSPVRWEGDLPDQLTPRIGTGRAVPYVVLPWGCIPDPGPLCPHQAWAGPGACDPGQALSAWRLPT